MQARVITLPERLYTAVGYPASTSRHLLLGLFSGNTPVGTQRRSAARWQSLVELPAIPAHSKNQNGRTTVYHHRVHVAGM